ncbi:MAG: carbohydrate ABC transporter permease [Erysipelotrichaceae bacterium]|nr:carbohydrate ABC transporter permease [Erysipelotrichaceae bacterium]
MKKEKIKLIITYVFLAIGAVIMLFPFYWMVLSAVQTRAEYASHTPVWIPSNPFNLENFIKAIEEASLGRYFVNSFIVTSLSVVITGFTTIIGAFAFSRLKFPGKEFIFGLLVAFMMVPFEMLVITNYQTVSRLKWIDSYHVLIIPFISSIFYTYILKGFFDTIPDSLYYSARIDGASNWKYLWRIMVPIAKPSLVTIMLLNAIASWNSFMWPQLVINSDKFRTVPFGLFAFMSDAGADTQLQLAAATITVLPTIILFLFARKYIVNGVARGGIKG